MTDKAMVAVCDILGFSNLVRNRPLQEIISYVGLRSDQVNCLIELIISKKERLILSLEHHF